MSGDMIEGNKTYHADTNTWTTRSFKICNFTGTDFDKGIQMYATYGFLSGTKDYCGIASDKVTITTSGEDTTLPVYTPPIPAGTIYQSNDLMDMRFPAITVSNHENCAIKCWDFDDIPYPEGTTPDKMICKYAEPCCATSWSSQSLFSGYVRFIPAGFPVLPDKDPLPLTEFDVSAPAPS